MSFVLKNPNPHNLNVGDCAIRAISIALDKPWNDVYAEVSMKGLLLSDMPSSNRVWGDYLEEQGFKLHIIPDSCPDCYSVKDFTNDYPRGTYVLGTGSHVVAVINGSYFDTWDSGNETVKYYWQKGEKKDVQLSDDEQRD